MKSTLYQSILKNISNETCVSLLLLTFYRLKQTNKQTQKLKEAGWVLLMQTHLISPNALGSTPGWCYVCFLFVFLELCFFCLFVLSWFWLVGFDVVVLHIFYTAHLGTISK